MKRVLLILSCLFCFVELRAQYIELNDFNYKAGIYDIFIIKPDSVFLNRFSIIRNTNWAPETKLSDSLNKHGLFFMMNAGIVDSTCTPLGLFISNGIEIRPINRDSGPGNFYLKPNGFFAVGKDSVSIASSEKYQGKKDFTWAIQSGPLLLDNYKINSTLNPGSKNKNLRCGVGSFVNTKGRYLVFINSKVPVSFYEFASVFAEKYKCDNALTLESGMLTSMILPSVKTTVSDSKVICNYIYINLN